jgi:copper chaperone CopZ
MCTTDNANDLGLTDANNACQCGSHEHGPSSPASISAEAVTEDYLVSGMTCAHCVASVTEELTALKGVESVRVDLNPAGPSKVTVSSKDPLDRGAVDVAIDEAGYSLISANG